jgi:hypothetical protein
LSRCTLSFHPSHRPTPPSFPFLLPSPTYF